MAKTVITPEISKFIDNNYLLLSSRKIASKLKISKTAVLKYLKKNSLIVPIDLQKEWKRKASISKPYTKKEKQFIIDNISTMSIKDIASNLKRCNAKIRDEIKELGLQYIVDQKAIESRFKKGHIPPNTGKKLEDFMSPENLAKFKANQFKKDSIPHNAKKDFEEVKRYGKNGKVYILIKVPGQRKLILKNRFVWQQHFGAIPEGHNIIFRDGNTENFDIDNLECISNLDLMKKNSLHNYPQDIKDILFLKSAITRQINLKQK